MFTVCDATAVSVDVDYGSTSDVVPSLFIFDEGYGVSKQWCAYCDNSPFLVSRTCSTYFINQGCSGNGNCVGQVKVQFYTASPYITMLDVGDNTYIGNCPMFSAFNTHNALNNVAPCLVQISGNNAISVDIDYYNNTNALVNVYRSNGGYIKQFCRDCNNAPIITGMSGICIAYTFMQGCKGDTDCSGLVSISYRSSSGNLPVTFSQVGGQNIAKCVPYTASDTVSANQNVIQCYVQICNDRVVTMSNATAAEMEEMHAKWTPIVSKAALDLALDISLADKEPGKYGDDGIFNLWSLKNCQNG